MGIVYVAEDMGHVGAGRVSGGEEVSSGYQPWGQGSGFGGFRQFCPHEFPVIEEAIASEAIDPVQFEFVCEAWFCEPSPHLGGAHILHVHELHVIGDGGDDGGDDLIGKLEPCED